MVMHSRGAPLVVVCCLGVLIQVGCAFKAIGPSLFAGGIFSSPAPRLAGWNAATGTWTTASGNSSTVGSAVYALTTFQDRLIAGGDFTAVEGIAANGVAQWDGTAWRALGPPGVGPSTTAYLVRAFAEYNGGLVVGGSFTTAGGTSANRVALWNGVEWAPLGVGLSATVRGLAVVNGILYAGGTFELSGTTRVNYIAQWSQTEWKPVGGGVNFHVFSLTSYEGTLIVAGEFWIAGDSVPGTVRIAQWNGDAWLGLGGGVSGSHVTATIVYGNNLIAGGLFTSVGGVPASNIARWNGTAWSPLGAGTADRVYGLAEFEGDLAVGGWFTLAGGVAANYVALWDGEVWAPLGSGVNDDVYALHQYGSLTPPTSPPGNVPRDPLFCRGRVGRGVRDEGWGGVGGVGGAKHGTNGDAWHDRPVCVCVFVCLFVCVCVCMDPLQETARWRRFFGGRNTI